MAIASCAITTLALCGVANAQQVWLVDPDNPTPGNGLVSSSTPGWSTSESSLDAVLANSNLAPDDFILLGEGVYKPDVNATTNIVPGNPSPGPRDHSFLLPKSVRIYGGYKGYDAGGSINSVSPIAPDGKPERTLLWGNIGNQGVATDNSYHVVYVDGALHGSFALKTVELRDLKIIGGYADGGGSRNNGGGLFVTGSAVVALPRGVEVAGNYADANGGGVYCKDAAIRMGRCVVKNNYAAFEGGGIFYHAASMDVPTEDERMTALFNLDLINNEAGKYGGGIYVGDASYPVSETSVLGGFIFANSLVRGNLAENGGGIYIGSWSQGREAELRHLTVAGNEALYTGGGVHAYKQARYHFCNSIVQGNSGGSGLAAPHTLGDDNFGIGVIPGTNPDPAVEEVHHCSIGFNPMVTSLQDPNNLGNVGVVWHAEPGYFNIIGDDPLFRNPASGDYRVNNGSTCLDVGHDGHLFLDYMDIDEDLDVVEFLPLDFRLYFSTGAPRHRENWVTTVPFAPTLGSITPVAGGLNAGSFNDLGCHEHKWITSTPPML